MGEFSTMVPKSISKISACSSDHFLRVPITFVEEKPDK